VLHEPLGDLHILHIGTQLDVTIEDDTMTGLRKEAIGNLNRRPILCPTIIFLQYLNLFGRERSVLTHNLSYICILFSRFFPGTRRTDTLDQETDSLTDITIGKVHLWDMQFMQAISFVTLLTEEMDVLIIVLLTVMAIAPFILGTPINTLYGMDQMVFPEKHECTENIGLIDGQNPVLQFGHGQRTFPCRECLHDEYTIGSGTNAMSLQQFNTVIDFHTQ